MSNQDTVAVAQDDAHEVLTDPVSQFREAIQIAEEKILASSRFQIETKDEKITRPLRRALRHAAGMRLLREKFETNECIHLYAAFNSGINAWCVYLNNKPVNSSVDNLVIWKATVDLLNRQEIATSVIMTTAVMLTVLGYEIYIGDSTEPFNAFIQGRDDAVLKAEADAAAALLAEAAEAAKANPADPAASPATV